MLDCSVIVLNYFGEKVIGQVLNSLLGLNYPKNKFEIIVVDNNSADLSRDILKSYTKIHKNIKTVLLDQNFGFSKGNNAGLSRARGKYVALLNNDCVVEPNWLKELMKTASKNQNVFAVNSKIKLFPSYLRAELACPRKTLIEECFESGSNLGKLVSEDKILIRPEMEGNVFKLEIPYDPLSDKTLRLEIRFSKKMASTAKVIFQNLPKKSYAIKFLEGRDVIEIKLKVNNAAVRKNSFDLIQNTGVLMFQDGSGRDIGALIKESKQYFEKDLGQFDKERQVYAACAAATLYRKSILKSMGGLDESFFMYYEDVDISERARFLGYEIIYCPKAVSRHAHSFSSKEWSAFFIYHSQRGRLMHVLFNFPLRIFFRELSIFFLKATIGSLNALFSSRGLQMTKGLFRNLMKKSTGSEDRSKFSQYIQYCKIIWFFATNLPSLLFKRQGRLLKVSKGAIESNFKSILSGRWYFN